VPTYQYSCTDCGHFFETFQSFSDDSLTVCPECEGKLRKVFNAVGVVFKGSGFYRNDSRGPEKSSEKSSEKTSSSNGSGKTADTGSEKKSEKTPEKKSAEKSSGTTSSASTPA
jgi:putative FmdB family regulatory protein